MMQYYYVFDTRSIETNSALCVVEQTCVFSAGIRFFYKKPTKKSWFSNSLVYGSIASRGDR